MHLSSAPHAAVSPEQHFVTFALFAIIPCVGHFKLDHGTADRQLKPLMQHLKAPG